MCLTNCTCEENYNGRIVLDERDNPNPSAVADIDVIGIAPIRVRTFMRGTTRVYEISLHVPSPPTASMNVNPTFVEFNTPFTATFTVNYAKGSEDLTTKVISPLPSPVPDTTLSPFMFTVTDTPTQVGARYVHTFTVTDTDNQSATATKGINVYYRYYRGLIPRNGTLNSNTAQSFESGVGASITGVFGAKRHYINNSLTDSHFCWLRPTDSPEMGTPVGDGNFPYEIRKEPYTVTINGAEYEIIKTINFYPVSTDVELSF